MFESANSRAHRALGDFTWSRLGCPRLTAGQIADKGRRTLRRLAEWDVKVPANCRLVRSVRRLEGHDDAPDRLSPLDDRGRNLTCEAARTAFELYVATHCGQPKPDRIALDKFAQAIEGADLPESEEAHSARDVQFEVYLWGLMHASGETCRFAEPDLIRSYGDAEAGIAAKRIWSLDQASRRLSLAANQIEASGLPGFIAINAQEYLTAEAGVANLADKAQAVSTALGRLHGHLPALARKNQVIGMFVGGSVGCWNATANGNVVFALTFVHQWLFIAKEGIETDTPRRISSAQGRLFADWMKANL